MPSRRKCAVFKCNSKAPLISLPNPKKHFQLFLNWVKSTGNLKYISHTPEQIFKEAYICQNHFTQNDIFNMKKRIKTCVPSKYLPDPVQYNVGIDYDPSNYEKNIDVEALNVLESHMPVSNILKMIETSSIDLQIKPTSHERTDEAKILEPTSTSNLTLQEGPSTSTSTAALIYSGT